ncbi:DUF4199 domain-containing protein [Mucilaginibacter ginkgonis]|uniref:DUF4199 domain-containing protein n=1 Tax=Mucilaginibacter ginkgonis TaxID=2682091 RepID=A0A6I4I045_9SPHI|nr:DUF4199 domain-containing protein [Mucilaginibacter ginkgonis]QQL48962.1 DUF4199 domain-containing protein [Mucilaginibacter ginkgonis]
MLKNVLTFGGIAGFVFILWMTFLYTACYNNPNYEGSLWLGYGSMIVAFAFIFVGVRNYREKYNNGTITFGKAFLVGLYIALIGSTVYVGAWLVDFYGFMPDFMDKYVAHTLSQMKARGASPAEIAKQKADMANYIEMYKSPFGVIILTYIEVLPVGLLIALIAALVLKKKPAGDNAAIA